MELRELGYFVAVYEERSVSAAARRSYVSQPSVSEALANLEHELATRLFVRHRKGTTPTAAGEQLYPIAQRMMAEARALPGLFHAAPGRRRLVLGLMRSLDIARVRDLVALLVRDDDLDLQLVDADQPSDLRIVARSMRAEAEVFVALWEERYVVAMPRNHPLAARPTLRTSDLAGARLVARCHCENAARFAGAGHRFEVVAVAPTEEWALALVAAGLGIAVIPEGVVSPDDAVVLRPLRDVQARREVGLAYGAHGAPTAGLQRIVETLVNRAGGRPGRGGAKRAGKAKPGDAGGRRPRRPRVRGARGVLGSS
jgi:DNA-binding transcriptional LysR family regulator